WRLAMKGTYRIVIGPRSAVFAPLNNLGLIVVDEEHEASYKQYDASPRYNARDVAIVRGTHTSAVVVLGSATPSAESFFNAAAGKYTLLEMPHRIDQVPMPDISIVDMTAERKREYAQLKESLPEDQRRKLKDFRQSSISVTLRHQIEDRLNKKEGIILLQNRRGFAPFVECPDCGYTEMCENCSITLTYHLTRKHLRCHYCGLVRAPHTQCPQCKGINIELRGVGTQRVEEELGTLFPNATILRMDLDTTSRKGAHDRILRKFGEGTVDILLGTQMVAKGLDFARVTLVGVISADTQMLLPDFRSSERTFQLLTQVAGRAGRSTLHGEVIIQTHQPQHYTLQHVVDHDIKKFYEEELEERRELDYPPFSRLALVETKGGNEPEVQKHSEKFAGLLKSSNGACTIVGPAPAVIAKINTLYRWHIIIKSPKTKDPAGMHLRNALRKALSAYEQTAKGGVRLTIDIDPVGLM
ncbi:MAG: primosomal protein N', partial [Bacteroidota bacterium]